MFEWGSEFKSCKFSFQSRRRERLGLFLETQLPLVLLWRPSCLVSTQPACCKQTQPDKLHHQLYIAHGNSFSNHPTSFQSLHNVIFQLEITWNEKIGLLFDTYSIHLVLGQQRIHSTSRPYLINLSFTLTKNNTKKRGARILRCIFAIWKQPQGYHCT